jgi:hypothetical protein
VIQREAARERAATEEHFVGLIDRVSQRTDAQFQQMQQGMMAMFGMISQLDSPRSSQDSQAFRALEHHLLQSHQLQPLLLQLPQRPRRSCSRCPHYSGL